MLLAFVSVSSQPLVPIAPQATAVNLPLPVEFKPLLFKHAMCNYGYICC